jgi:acetyl-CoA acetyltransferase
VTEYLGLNPRYINGTMVGGSSFVAHLLPAMMALQAGQCNAVLVCYGSTQRTSTFGRSEIAKARRVMDPQPYETPYEPMQPLSAYALAARRHMHQYGTTRRDLAEVAVAARAWAQLNPEAFMRDPLSIDDVLKARRVSDPLSVRDCCLVTDGGGAFVLTRADRRSARFFDSWGLEKESIRAFTFDKAKAGEGKGQKILIDYHQTFLARLPTR